MSVFSKIKKWIIGKDDDDNKIKQANRISNYGGGVSTKKVQTEVKASIKKAEKKKETEAQVSKAFQSNSIKKAEAKDRQTSKASKAKKASTTSDPFNTKNAFKAKPYRSTALGGMSERDIKTRTAKINAYNENRKYQSRAADKLKPLIEEKYNPDTAEGRQRIKMGDYQSDPNVMKYETLKHPIASSLARGGLSGTTFGLSELAMDLLPKNKEVEEAERLYQANKSKGFEFAGEMAGSLVGFGLTGGLSKQALTRAMPKTTARLGEGATEYLAKNALVRRAAEREAIRKLGVTATEEEIKRLARARAARLVEAVGEDMAINLTTGAVSDISHSIIDSDNPAEFIKNMAINTGMNLGLGGLTTVAPALYRGSALDESMRAMGGDVADFGNDIARHMDNKRGGIKLAPDDPLYDLFGDGSVPTRNYVRNGGTTRSSRLQGVQYENGFKPKKAGKAKADVAETVAKSVKSTAEDSAPKEASEVLQGYSSKGSKKKLSDAKKKIRQLMADGNTKAAQEEISRVVDDVVRNTKSVREADSVTEEIREELRNTRISISNKTDAGYKSGSFNKFRQKNFGAFKLTDDGTPVDDVWQSLQERYGTSLFPDDVDNPSDQLQHLADLAKKKGKEIELADDEVEYLKDELSRSLWADANKDKKIPPEAKTKAEPPKERVVIGDGKRSYEIFLEDFGKNRKETITVKANNKKEATELAYEYGKKQGLGYQKFVKKAASNPETAFADEAASSFSKRRAKTHKKITERYKFIDEVYDADKTGNWVFYRDKTGELCVGNPNAEHGRIRRENSYRYEDNGDYFGKLTQENFDKAKKAFDEGNFEPFVSKSKKGVKQGVEPPEPKAKSDVDPFETYKKNRQKEKANAKAKAEPPKAQEDIGTSVAIRDDVAKAGENAKAEKKAGERTEFKRSEEPSAKEKARNKRAEQRKKATQEDFDRDFADFEKKVNENREKVGKLNGRLRAASTAEEKQAIKDEIKALDEEIKRLHRKASLKYHPDMGGSNEWAQKFNTTYDEYTKRVYSSPNFSGASSKSSTGGTRNNTYKEYRQTYKRANTGGGSTPPPKSAAGAGGGGNTPPPRGGKYADYDGLRRPRGYAKRTQRAMHSVEDMVGAIRTKKTWREAARSFREEANRKFVDSMKDFEQVARERKKTLGKEAMQKLYGAIDKARRYRAVATTSVGSHQMKWDGTRYQVKGADGVMRDAPSIAEIFSGMDAETEKSFNAYLLLQHNVDRLREGKPVFENTVIYNEELSKRLGLPKDIDLMDADVCKKLAQDYEVRFPDFIERAAQVRQYTANELNNRMQAGLLSRDMMDKWLHDHPNYVPTYREGLFDGVGAVKGGSVGASDLRAAKGSDLNIYDIKEQLADATVRNWRDISLNNLLENTFGENVAKLANSAEISPHMFALDHTMNVGKAADGGKYYADIYRNGKAERIEIDKRFYDDLKDLYKNGRMGNGLDALNDKVLVPLANLWKNLITEWSPIFMVKNFMRDYPEAIINSRNRKEFLEITANGSALKDLLGRGQFSQSLRDAGISSSTFIDIDKAVKAWEKGNGSLKDLIPRLNAGVEMFPRLVEYMATLKKAGYDLKTVNVNDIPMEIRDMAAANAADVTVNFGRNGSVGKMINKGFVPFFNPSVQGWSKFARNITELDGVGDTISFLLATTALGTAPMVAQNLLYHNNDNYQQISARDKANNYIIAIPPYDDSAEMFVKIPRSRFASVYGLPLVNVANENKMGWAEAIRVVNDQVAPINPLESHFGANVIQAARNKTWYGTPIESESMQSLPANERYDATTSGISIKTAEALNKVTKGKVKVSPKKLDYVLDANFGVIADVALPITTKANKGDSVPARIANVGKKAFTIDSVTQNNISTRYYDKSTLLEQNKNSSDATAADQLAYKKFSSWDSRVKNVTNAMRYIQNSDMPNKQEAYRELRKLRNEDMQKALDGKVSLNNTRDISIIHKYAGTSYTIENLGKSADKKALKTYSAAVYGDLSEKELARKIDSDTEFYKGYKGIVKTQNALQRVDTKLKGSNALTYAVGLADANANDDVFAAYDTTVKSRTESASKANRAKEYLKNNGSVEEFAQLENVVKNLGKLPDVDKDKLEDEAYKKLQKGEMSIDKYNTELKKIDYNANLSYVGKAVSLALSGAPDRAYNLYDIKNKNVQKGYNLAAMGIDSRQYREMSKACDKDGNGYLKTAEIRDYVAKSDVEDKATLFDALCYYPNVRNPFGAPSTYSAAQAAESGRRSGVKQIKVNGGKDSTKFIEGNESSSGWQGGYYRSGYRKWHRWGHGGGRRTASTAVPSAFKAKKASVSGSVSTGVDVKRTASVSPKINITPLNVKTVKPNKTGSTNSSLASALEDIKQTQKKVAPPKARRSK